MAHPTHVGDIEPIKSLVSGTERYRRHNDEVAASQAKERGSLPPSAPKLPTAPIELTAERTREIARAVISNPTMLGLVPLLQVEPYISPAEFAAFCKLAVKGAGK